MKNKANKSHKILHKKETLEESVNTLNNHFTSMGQSIAYWILEKLKLKVDFLAKKKLIHQAPR